MNLPNVEDWIAEHTVLLQVCPRAVYGFRPTKEAFRKLKGALEAFETVNGR